MKFDRIAVVDWSGAGKPSPTEPTHDAIWIGLAEGGQLRADYHRTRASAAAALHALCTETLRDGGRLLIAADFAFGYPSGFAQAVAGTDTLGLWAHLGRMIRDGEDNGNNHRAVAATLNRGFGGDGPFWGNSATADVPDLPRLRGPLPPTIRPFRETELAARVLGFQPKSVWQLSGAGAVGAQTLLGIARFQRLRDAFGAQVSVWPFEPATGPIVMAEVYPSLLRDEILLSDDPIPDRAQVLTLARALRTLPTLAPLFEVPGDAVEEEGAILGLSHLDELRKAAARLSPPPLKDDCFALPPGVDWTPVDDALARLRDRLHSVVATERLERGDALGRVLAEDVAARRSNPPAPNSAVDGYGFAHSATGSGPQELPLLPGRAAAGVPYPGRVPEGAAVRILTGAILPEGVDTVVLEEDTRTDATRVAFRGPVKPFANTRRAGEDVAAGGRVLRAGHRLRAPDLALLAATGVRELPLFRPLRVGVLSTGDEVEPDPTFDLTDPTRIHDANRPMLLALMRGWGHEAVDLGHVGDDRGALAARLEAGAHRVDAIFTSGGASAGDEDHVAALLRERGALQTWRIAVKPGRPLALALWNGVPVFGLPGNPVAAFVCTLIFGRPALAALSGEGWYAPQAYTVPAAFTKNKKAGRREYLRARLDDQGHAEAFASEGSGRISGLTWATGLVELGDGAVTVRPGDPVRFLPYASFGI